MHKEKTVEEFEHQIAKFEVAKLDLRDGDIVVLRTELTLTPSVARELQERAEAHFKGAPVVVLSHGMSLAVVQDKRHERASFGLTECAS